jgi:plasmid maintenance system antidote protein VapI
MEHRGEIIEQAVRNSGLAISKIAAKLGKSRRWMYLMFENPNVPYETVLEIGKILHHDFSDDLKLMQTSMAEPIEQYGNRDLNYWREKYYALLEEYNELLKKK